MSTIASNGSTIYLNINRSNANSDTKMTQLDNTHDIILNTHHSLNYLNELTNSNYIPIKNEDGDNYDENKKNDESDQNEQFACSALIFALIKQYKPGMNSTDLNLPTFVLEPKSFLEKLAELFSHSDILTEACKSKDSFERFKIVTKFYISSLYKQPRELKKPYTPILGELYRTYWYDPKTQSKTFYVAEQVSHQPPVSSFFVSNRKVGFCIHGSITTKTKLNATSFTTLLIGSIKIVLLKQNEEYKLSFPFLNCAGFLSQKIRVELGGSVKILSNNTDYSAELDFKLKSRSNDNESKDLVEGKIKFKDDLIATLVGKWNDEIKIFEKYSSIKEASLLNVNNLKQLKRFHVSINDQTEYESEKLWYKVSEAIRMLNESKLAEELKQQRVKETELKLNQKEYYPKLFMKSGNDWIYRYLDLRPWDSARDLFQYETNFKILTRSNNRNNQSEISSCLIEQTKNNLNKLELERTKAVDLILKFQNLKQHLNELEINLNKIVMKTQSKSDIIIASLSTVDEENED